MANNFLAQLLNRVSSNPQPGMLGSGMAANAARSLQTDDAYRRHVEQAQLNGEQPMTREEFMRQYVSER